MPKLDLRIYKGRLREQSKQFRRGLSPQEKLERDQAILHRVTALRQYQFAGMVVCYVSTAIEVDTRELIRHAWAHHKQVVVPRCIDGTRLMEFYRIRSFDDLERHTFGVLEPIPERCEKVTEFPNSICIVPALVYDLEGHRLGYGAGYYDRFLSGYSGFKVGIAYRECIRHRLHHGRFDVPVNLLVTEKYIRRTDRRPVREKKQGVLPARKPEPAT